MEKSAYEMHMMLLITGVTNFMMVLTLLLLHRQRRPLALIVGYFTMVITSSPEYRI
jgi:hypothetical protein